MATTNSSNQGMTDERSEAAYIRAFVVNYEDGVEIDILKGTVRSW